MRHRLSAAGFALVAASVLLSACNATPGASACNVSVNSAELVHQRQAVGVADCSKLTGASSRLPAVEVACLGSAEKVALDQIKGPAIINFWGSNCHACIKEMPALAAFDKAYGDQVQIIGVDYADTYPGAALQLAQQTGVHYPSLADPCAHLAGSSLRIPGGLPFFYFVRADGSVTTKPVLGGLTSLAQVKALAEKNLGITLEAAS
ncbi:TlpA disulfide reductase family protein [Nocardioides montaniterrae]